MSTLNRFYVIYNFVKENSAWLKEVDLFLDDLDSRHVADKTDVCFARFYNVYSDDLPMYLVQTVPVWYDEILEELLEVLPNYSIEVIKETALTSNEGAKAKASSWDYGGSSITLPKKGDTITHKLVLFKIDCKKFTNTTARWYSLISIGMLIRLFSVNEGRNAVELTNRKDAAKSALDYFARSNVGMGGHGFCSQDTNVEKAIMGLNDVDRIDKFNYEEYNKKKAKGDGYGYPSPILNMKQSNNFIFLKEVVVANA